MNTHLQTGSSGRVSAPPTRPMLSKLCVLALLALRLPSLDAETIHVPDDQPTIQAAVNAAAEDDTIIVHEGLYKERVDVETSGLTIKGEGHAKLIGGFLVETEADDLTVQDMHIVSGVAFNSRTRSQAFNVSWGATDLTIRGNVIENIHGRAYETAGSVHGFRVESNVIRNVSHSAYINNSSNVVLRQNYFEGPATVGLSANKMYDYRMENNTFVSPTGPNLSPPDDQYVLVSNNFIRTPSGSPTLQYTGDETFPVHAEWNWWGSTNGPYDPLGSVEVASGTPDPGVANLLNTEPAGQLSGWLVDYGSNGTHNIDYFPWAMAPIDNAYSLPTSVCAWVSLDYGPANANDGHTWGVDAFDTVQDAVNAVWSGTVYVASGTYNVTDQLYINKHLRVESVSGPEKTVLVANSPDGYSRVVFMNHASAVLAGFTVTGGRTAASPKSYEEDGGGVYCLDGTVERCIVTNNAAQNAGGGIWLANDALVRNCLVARNSAATDGGGIYIDESHGNVEFCTIAHNEAANGGGISAAEGQVSVRNSIVYFNEAPSGTNWATPGATGIATNRFVEYTSSPEDLTAWGDENITNNPQFVDAAIGDYRLGETSPCLDAGINALSILTDMLDIPRPLDGDADGTATADMGCFEFLNRAADSDSDGMPDGFESDKGLDPIDEADADGNLDEDPHTNLEEYIADTDPLDASDYFRITAVSNLPPWTVYFDASPDRIYTLLGRTNLTSGSWIPVPDGGPRLGIGGLDSLSDDNEPPKGPFYRLKVELP